MRNGTAREGLQVAWNAFPSLIHWEFSVLSEITPKVDTRMLRAVEAEFIMKVDSSKRMNHRHRTTVRREKYQQVIDMLDAGARYVDISEQLEISMGMISKIRKQSHPL